jgi:anaerobic selenocysteine-containing dehydrogenase
VDPLVAAAAAGALLLALWVGANRRHAQRRSASAGEWEGERADLWTSAARCPSCAAPGGLLSRVDGELWYSCLACGQRHRREHQG